MTLRAIMIGLMAAVASPAAAQCYNDPILNEQERYQRQQDEGII
jgi:hypothetical protein